MQLCCMMAGKGNKQALANNDEISLVLLKNKGFLAFFDTVKMTLFVMFALYSCVIV